MWNKQISILARGYLVITFVMQESGKSEMPSGEFARYRDLSELLQYPAIVKACVSGISMVAAIDGNGALERPEYIDALVMDGDQDVPDIDKMRIVWSRPYRLQLRRLSGGDAISQYGKSGYI